MVKRLVFSLVAPCLCLSAAVAQSGPPENPRLSQQNGIVYLSKISSIGLETKLADGRTLSLPRHQIAGNVRYALPRCGGGGGVRCLIPPNVNSSTVFFHESDFEADGAMRGLFAVCRRAMESARPTDVVELQGDFEVWIKPSFVIFRKLRSCVVVKK